MALYLKYRPIDFSSLVWQEFIKSTLRAAVSQDKTVGAYIFTGPRGTGKTSTARIFAKAINCSDIQDGDPCGKCDICSAFATESLIDVVEIDAASHTWVDNIRDIIEKAQFRPTNTKYKIYIVDEVHMLSKWAFNALLKILEEPPKHVKFILATTEIHKVPETILSRCQRYDFRNFSDEDIKSRLEYIAKHEKIDVDSESYDYIVKNAEWWMRNAVSLFEQLISGSKINYSHIVSTLGIASSDEISNFITLMSDKSPNLMDSFLEMLAEWKNMKIFLKTLMWELQEKAIGDLKSGKNITTKIEMLECLQDILMKSKNSFDESMTMQVWFLKYLSGYSNGVEWVAKHQSPTLENKTTKKVHKPVVEKKTPESDTSDILKEAEDIFGDIAPKNEVATSESWKSAVDVDALIGTCKKHGAKAALAMTLKGSHFDLSDDVLSVKTKTKIALWTISKTENLDIIMQALKSLSIEISDIKVS